MKDRDFREEIVTLFEQMVNEIQAIRGLLEEKSSPRKVSPPAVKVEPKKESDDKPTPPRRNARK